MRLSYLLRTLIFSAALLASPVAHSAVTLPTPVAHIDFEGCDGAPYTNPTEYGGAACVAGIIGSCADFDGGDDGLEIPDEDAFHMTDALTVSAWVRPADVWGIASLVNRWYTPDSYALWVVDGRFEFWVAFPDDGPGVPIVVGAPASKGVWTHVTGVWDGAWLSLYLDGLPASAVPAVGILQQSTRPLAIGNHPSWSAFEGMIDEVRLYDQALTPPQVLELSRLLFADGFESGDTAAWN